MAPTEHTILTNFLLAPAALPSIVTFSAFKSFFPRAEQSSPEIKRLYRTLQHNRSLLIDGVAENIEHEAKRGNAQRRVVVRARRTAEKNEPDEEVIIENAVCDNSVSREWKMGEWDRTFNFPLPNFDRLMGHLP
jgi:centromere-localized protein 2